MKLSENWYVDAPWAQLLCSTKIPDDKLQKFITMTDEVLNESDSQGTDGPFRTSPSLVRQGSEEVVPTSWVVTLEKFQKYDVYNYTMETITNYMNTVLSNGNVKHHMDTAISDGPHTQWNSRIGYAWVVSQKEDDYLPVHAHSQLENGYQHSKISAVLYLKIPKQMKRKPDEASIKMGKDGQIAFTGMGDADPFMTTSLYNIQPEVGWFYLYPSTLNHQVYPFKGEGERRSIGFNVDIISKEQLEKLKKLQGEK